MRHTLIQWAQEISGHVDMWIDNVSYVTRLWPQKICIIQKFYFRKKFLF